MGNELADHIEGKRKEIKVELYHDNFQNFKRYNIPKAQLVIADIPYNIGADAYGSNPMWYNGGDNRNGERKLAKSAFFDGDGQFKIAEYKFAAMNLKKLASWKWKEHFLCCFSLLFPVICARNPAAA